MSKKRNACYFTQIEKITPLSLSINSKQIERIEFIGYYLDSCLTWKHHIDMVANKVSGIIGILYRLKHCYPQYILLTIYNSLIVSHFNYGLLNSGTKIKLQQKSIRLITNCNYRAHTEPLFKQLNTLKIKDMFYMKMYKLLYKLSNDSLPQYFNVYLDLLKKVEVQYHLRRQTIPLPLVKHTFAESCLSYQLMKLINYTDQCIMEKIANKTHSSHSFSIYVKNNIVSSYVYYCDLLYWYVCGRN